MSDDESPMSRPLVQLTISAPADQVWRALREPDRIRQWFGWDADSLGEEIDFIFVRHARASDADRIVWFDGTADRIEVEDHGASSVVRVVRSGAAADTSWDEIFDEMTQGWIKFFHQLRFALERHPADRRRTVHLYGSPRVVGGALGAAALGLPPLEVGAPVAGPVGPEDRLTGRAWHQGRHQRGVTVDQWGDGLLVVADRPPTDDKPGASRLILTTYGLDDEAFAALQARWSAWWAARFVPDGSSPA